MVYMANTSELFIFYLKYTKIKKMKYTKITFVIIKKKS